MELLACPKCGSEWFVSTRSGERIVFQVDEERQPLLADEASRSNNAAPINAQHIFCGACTWQGPASDLVESHM
jgi:hypothetical protein